MPRTKVSVPDVAEVAAGLWSNAIRAGDMLFISGQVARPLKAALPKPEISPNAKPLDARAVRFPSRAEDIQMASIRQAFQRLERRGKWSAMQLSRMLARIQ
jgi:enamine deaminase RidA (YjgF/YER057c/UK114 family)